MGSKSDGGVIAVALLIVVITTLIMAGVAERNTHQEIITTVTQYTEK